MKVFHLTYWYPNPDNPQTGIFIKNHIEGLKSHCKNDHFHVQIIESKHFFKKEKTAESIIIKTRFAKYYKLQEFLAFRISKRLLRSQLVKEADIINIHIAAPLAIHLQKLQKIAPKPFVITEHWTAYYRFFGLKPEHKGLQRLKAIFSRNVRLITVSKALGEDIKRFSGNEHLEYDVIPNIINTDLFKFQSQEQPTDTYFMLTNWSPEKNPMAILKALSKLKTKWHLNIGGDGVQLSKMKNFIESNSMAEKVTFLGRISPKSVAEQFQKASAFIHSAHYETFSVVCAEALCSGCPVIASNIPAITEYLNESAGILVRDFEVKNENDLDGMWFEAISNFDSAKYNRSQIASQFSSKFGHEKVSLDYYNLLKTYVER